METVIRKTAILYKTAVEYGDYSLNLGVGCSHGCKYCYAMDLAKRSGWVHSYEEWTTPKLYENCLEMLSKDIAKLKDQVEKVQLCFTTDPFMQGHPEVQKMALACIRLLNNAGIRVSVLTKGILPIDELSELHPENECGITLVSLNETYRQIWEPGAAPQMERLRALAELHTRGCKTWISMKPYPTPNIVEQNLGELLETVKPATDKIIFGRMHYRREVSAFLNYKAFYNSCASQVVDFCSRYGLEYHVKAKTVTLM